MNSQTWENPVYAGDFADPFVWKHGTFWYAVGTSNAAGVTAAGGPGVFPLLKSDDFLTWSPINFALEMLEPEFGTSYWAPEIAFSDGKFWLYYSVGREDKSHGLRVAASSTPEGPFRDTGSLLTNPFECPFAIDASPFEDDDGKWYLFYARDFLDTGNNCRPGTGVVVDRLTDMTHLAGEPRIVARASFDWQRFQMDRIMYGGRYDWHTVEGPCVRKRLGKYWCLFSTGRWENETYGVDWAVSDSVGGPWLFNGSSGGARLLRTVPCKVIGPGHNSIAVGPDGRTEFLVYHAWDAGMTARRMFIDRLEWTEAGPRCAGPLTSRQKL